MSEFITWQTLVTFSGAVAMTGVIVQFTKELPYIINIRTQIWSYFVSLVILFAATYFTSGLTFDKAVLILFNAVIVSLSSNGGFEFLDDLLGSDKND